MAKKKQIQTSENTNARTSLEFLPKYFRSDTNKKFLGATVDQLISEGTVTKINGFIGRKTAKAYKTTDIYVDSVIDDRVPYRLEPAVVARDNLNNVDFFKDYADYINQHRSFNPSTINHDSLNKQQSYSWDPHIDWDKIVNYREYYWLPTGPQSIPIKGQSRNISSTFSVKLSDEGDNQAYVFSPDGLTRNPTLKLYRGQTYRFEIDCPGQPIAFSTTRSFFPKQSLIIATESGIETGGLYEVMAYDLTAFDTGSWAYNTLIVKTDKGPFNLYDIWTDGVSSATVYVERGIIEFTIPENSPNVLYYVSKNDINTSGLIKLFDIVDATSIDVETEIVGKKNYTLEDGTPLSNGMKIFFLGQVSPPIYANKNFFVEGVGSGIILVAEDDLLLPGPISDNRAVEFDNEGFSTQGFDFNYAFPAKKDYIVINRASPDRNQWSRYNKWFHSAVIQESARINGAPADLDQAARARRPIIEFEAGLKLFNFGIKAKKYVDLVDTKTRDVFGSPPVGGVTNGVEGSLGYTVDGVDLIPGMRVMFTNDPDVLVNGRIYRIGSVTHLAVRRLTLIAEPDSTPQLGEVVISAMGNTAGTVYHYMGERWVLSQQKTQLHQSPMFDVFDTAGISYAEKTKYLGSSFQGTTIIRYKPGTVYDAELQQNISYRNIENIGDIVFDFDLHTDQFQYQENSNTLSSDIETGYLLKTHQDGTNNFVNGWATADLLSDQWVIRQYDVDDTLKNFFPIDVYEKSGTISDLQVRVFVNNKKQSLRNFELFVKNSVAHIRLFDDLTIGDVLLIKTKSNSIKTSSGYYEFPTNLEDNPLNENLTDLTLGQIVAHATSIIDNLDSFQGSSLGVGNLRDLGPVSAYGRKIMQHSGPLLPIIYHTTNKEHNIIFALKFASDEYGKFKRNFLKVSEDLGFDGDVDQHLDLVLAEMFKDSSKTMPFYLSDMVGYRANRVFRQQVIDDSVTDYPLLFNFNLDTPSDKSVLVYLNDQLLVYGKDYAFTNENFVKIFNVVTDDELRIVQYESTDACFIPPTPSKLGIYPSFIPAKFVDDTYQTPTVVIQGHDGSITVAYNDFRDNLLLELETRIYNNIKIKYDNYLIDMLPGYFRRTEISNNSLNAVLAQEFLQWNKLINADFTRNDVIDEANPWTYNYSNFTGYNNLSELAGFWRGIYLSLYDTDRPHSHPWEILGFTHQPLWWENEYGPAPYTNNNFILWTDIAEGKIKDSKFPRYDVRYARPTILDHLPVDNQGKLISPLASGFIKDFYSSSIAAPFVLGDRAPVESAWSKSGQYPFSVIIALVLLKPAEMFSKTFDKIRQIKVPNGQIVYRTVNGDKRFGPSCVVFPSTAADTNREFTSGLVNYVMDYIVKNSYQSVEKYKNTFRRLSSNMAVKLEGFVSKDKFRLILDSRSPLNDGNVFVPKENYQIFLNTSNPNDRAVYSGVIVEKSATGFVVNGYSVDTAEFKYFKPTSTAADPIINVGGISAPFNNWKAEQQYAKGTVVKYENVYYRVAVEHTSSLIFEAKFFAALSSLPMTGGRDIILRSRFDNRVSTVYYGSTFYTVQEVVDFLLGYGKYLESLGFLFDSFNSRLQTIVDFSISAKEFAFWTTQNWNVNSAIALSPAAQSIKFFRNYSVVDDIYNGFYQYNILKQDGSLLDSKFTNTSRLKNEFTLSPYSTADGIYHAPLDLVSKEHVLLIDNVTIFNDIIYDKVTGYRQDRIKVVGYKTEEWNGDFSVPGFIYDRVTLTNWEPWSDYAMGDTVKFKEFFYSARKNIAGTLSFAPDAWNRLVDRPESKLIPNWEYRANQFADFYDLDTDSFDIDQQKFAQHLIGYQPRGYLANIINDDVAQYKFYQGMIREKGTRNSLDKMFDALNRSEKDSIEFYDVWALRLGQYGGSDAFSEFEVALDESKMRINPQPIDLVFDIPTSATDLVYRILPGGIDIKPDGYVHTPFPVLKNNEELLNTAGYVRLDDVNYTVINFDDIVNLPLAELKEGEYIWVAYYKSSWDVRRFTTAPQIIINATLDSDGIKLFFNRPVAIGWKRDEFLVIKTEFLKLNAIHRVREVTENYVLIENSQGADSLTLASMLTSKNFTLYMFKPWRFGTIDDTRLTEVQYKPSELVWIDNNRVDWKVWKHEPKYQRRDLKETERRFARNFVVSHDNQTLITTNFNKLTYFTRAGENFNWSAISQIDAFTDIPFYKTTNSLTFGESLALSKDGNSLIVGAPRAGGMSGDSSQAVSEGFVVLYTRTALNDFYYVNQVYTSVNRIPLAQFGYRTAFLKDNTLAIATKGTTQAGSAIYKFAFGSQTILTQVAFSQTIVDMTSSDTTLVVSLSNNTIKILDHALHEKQTLSLPGASIIEYASSVATDATGKSIAVGAPLFTDRNTEQGAVIVYELVGDTYVAAQVITSPTAQESEQFGFQIEFFNSDQLLVFGRGGYQTFELTFDSSGTIFDSKSTQYIDNSDFTGTVRLYDRYDRNFVYSIDLETAVINGNVIEKLGPEYGSVVQVVNNHVYINDPRQTSGTIYEYVAGEKSWNIYRQASQPVDLDRIKSIFLYNTETDTMVEELDFLDPSRGKIPGIAEQEISYKLPYDPAVYSQGDEATVVDPLSPWSGEHVGKLWWDVASAKFLESNQGEILYKVGAWNSVFPGTTVKIYEWVESEYSPVEWLKLTDTEDGLTRNISGRPRYENTFTIKRKYDSISKTFRNTYYYWVENTRIVPAINGRRLSAFDISKYIEDPKSMQLRYANILSANQISLVNCNSLMLDKKINLNVRIWNIENKTINVHSHYQLVSEFDELKQINPFIEQKWIDSLIGFDKFGNDVPDTNLPKKLKYGVANKPRQGMFINRLEALKQFIERVNAVLAENLIADRFQYDVLDSKEEPPVDSARLYDLEIDLIDDLRFVDVADLRTAQLTPVIEKGNIVRVIINNPGRKYRKPPAITISGNGIGAELRASINTQGQITGVIVTNPGQKHDSTTVLRVRPFTILVASDETAAKKWSLYQYGNDRTWFRYRTQVFDTTLYWNNKDWYAAGYNQFTKIDHLVDFIYQTLFEEVAIGETVKINNYGAGGWTILEKVSASESLNFSDDYKTVARQNGTIKFDLSLYNYRNSRVGFDGPIFDNLGFDEQPIEELRIIIDCIRNNLLINELKPEYKKAFFAGLRYVFSEQPSVDWAFKTSFISGKHNLGELAQPPNFRVNNLSSYQDFIEEVKPYSSKIKEFVSAHEKTEQTRSKTTDFDLPAIYNKSTRQIETIQTSTANGIINYNTTRIEEEPFSDWYDAVGYGIISIAVVDPGQGYLTAPTITIIGLANDQALARAYISNGRILRVDIENAGSGYILTPTIEVSGPVADSGYHAVLAPVLGHGLARSNRIGMKFDRLSSTYLVKTLLVSQSFVGTGSQVEFNLRWPVDLKVNKTLVKIFNEELLPTDYVVENVIDSAAEYTRHHGRIIFDVAPVNFGVITVIYDKAVELLDAADRINYFYSPTEGMLAQDLGQLMVGVDYGGVELTGLNFGVGAGWDALPWTLTGWDNFDETFTDFIVKSDGSTRSWILPYTPADGEIINVYLNGLRIDDPLFNQVRPLAAALAVKRADLSQSELLLNRRISDKFSAQYDVSVITAQLDAISTALISAQASLAADPTNQTFADLVLVTQASYAAINSQLPSAAALVNQLTIDISNIESGINAINTDINNLQQQLLTAPILGNTAAIMNSFIGDGSSPGPIEIPATADFKGDATPNNIIDTIVFRKATSDGSFKPDARTLDVDLSGGDLAYRSARGIRPEEINIDGDGFVTEYSSHAPEEVVPGQILDTVDITVYDSNHLVKSFILFDRYKLNGIIRSFKISQKIQNQQSIIVKLDGSVLIQDRDYSVNYRENSITLLIPNIATANELFIASFGKNAANLLDTDIILVGDPILEFVTSAKDTLNYTLSVTVDGTDTAFTTFVSDSSSPRPGNIGFRFTNPIPADALLEYILLDGISDSISRMQKFTAASNGSQLIYQLPNEPAFNGPLENSVLVDTNGSILRPNKTFYFTSVNGNASFQLEPGEVPLNSITITRVIVHVNGKLKKLAVDYDWNSPTNLLRFRAEIVKTGDRIAVSLANTGDYSIELGTNGYVLSLNTALPVNQSITVTTFTNHDILEIERFAAIIRAKTIITPNTAQYFKYNLLRTGIVRLPRPVNNIYAVWVIKSSQWLTPNMDYIIEDGGRSIKINPAIVIQDTDIIDIILFNNASDIDNAKSIGFRIVKDVLNRTVYLRINDNASTALAEPLTFSNLKIAVVDADDIPDPVPSRNLPGVVVIDGERIEYLAKDGNILSQLRRGTFGTGIKNSYPINTIVSDYSLQQTIPYKDEFVTNVSIADGDSREVILDYIPKLTDTSLNTGWFRDTIPVTHGQCDELEIFVAGRRLRKQPAARWSSVLGPDSPSGDQLIEAEFSVDGKTAQIRLTAKPAVGAKILVQKRMGRSWNDIGTTLRDTSSEISMFIKQGVAYSPGTPVDKYIQIDQALSPDALLIENGSGPLTDETGNPLKVE